jgi:hypothetical protein
MHRLAAAKKLKLDTVDVQYFDGDAEEAFVTAVRLNVVHGLPLSLADRRTAATRIMRSHAEWSDRKIARLVGLSPKTVGAVRRSSTEEIPHLQFRVGRDGKARHLPDRKRDGDPRDAVSTGRAPRVSAGRETGPGLQRRDHVTTLRLLSRDPALRMSETGRFLLRLLDMHFAGLRAREQLVTNIPSHCADSVADLARQCAESWLDFADRVARDGTTAADQELSHSRTA